MKVRLIDKYHAVKYAAEMRAEGYRLLRNPKGTPSNQVNLIRTEIKHNKFMDKETYTDRVTATFENGKQTTVKKFLSTVNFFDTEKMQMSKKKNIFYFVSVNGKEKPPKFHLNITEEEALARKAPHWDSEKELKAFKRQQKIDDIMSDAYEGKTRKPPLLALLCSFGKKGFEKVTDGLPLPAKYPNFVKTMFQNLTNKA